METGREMTEEEREVVKFPPPVLTEVASVLTPKQRNRGRAIMLGYYFATGVVIGFILGQER